MEFFLLNSVVAFVFLYDVAVFSNFTVWYEILNQNDRKLEYFIQK